MQSGRALNPSYALAPPLRVRMPFFANSDVRRKWPLNAVLIKSNWNRDFAINYLIQELVHQSFYWDSSRLQHSECKSLQKEELPHTHFSIPRFCGLALMDVQNHPYPICDETLVVSTMESTKNAGTMAYTCRITLTICSFISRSNVLTIASSQLHYLRLI